jgi:sugar phosphate isomerase/epimerase
MARPVTLFTGQWADLPLEELAAKTGGWGFDGLELACWGDHFEVGRALAEPSYCADKRALLERHGLQCWAIGAHLVGQAVCDRIDTRHRGTLSPEIWGDGEQEGVRQRAAEELKDTARAAAAMGVTVVTGFTGSPVWHLLYSFPPNDFEEIERGYEEVAERFSPILDVFDHEGVRFAL